MEKGKISFLLNSFLFIAAQTIIGFLIFSIDGKDAQLAYWFFSSSAFWVIFLVFMYWRSIENNKFVKIAFIFNYLILVPGFLTWNLLVGPDPGPGAIILLFMFFPAWVVFHLVAIILFYIGLNKSNRISNPSNPPQDISTNLTPNKEVDFVLGFVGGFLISLFFLNLIDKVTYPIHSYFLRLLASWSNLVILIPLYFGLRKRKKYIAMGLLGAIVASFII